MPEIRDDIPPVLNKLEAELTDAFERSTRNERIAAAPLALPRRRSRRPLFAIAAAVAACLLVAVALVGIGRDQSPIGVGVEEALASVAHRLELAPHPKPTQFEYTYAKYNDYGVETAGMDQLGRVYSNFVVIQPRVSQTWLSVKTPGAGRERAGIPGYPSARDARIGKRVIAAMLESNKLMKTPQGRRKLRPVNKKRAAYVKKHGNFGSILQVPGVTGVSIYGVDGHYNFAGESLNSKQLAAYPRDPKAIYDRMHARFTQLDKEYREYIKKYPGVYTGVGDPPPPPSVEDQLWANITSSFVEGQLLPVDLRAGMIRALAYVEGVKAAGDAKDAYGREAVKFTREDDGIRSEVLYDKQTSVILANATYVTDPAKITTPGLGHLPAGTKLGSYQLVEKKTVDRIPRSARRQPKN